MKKNGELKNKNFKKDIREKEEMFTILGMHINNAGLVGNTAI
jgi:hypothetical protein